MLGIRRLFTDPFLFGKPYEIYNVLFLRERIRILYAVAGFDTRITKNGRNPREIERFFHF